MTTNSIMPELFRNLRRIDPETKVIYCNRCVMSNQRPRISFNDEGVCSACLFAEYKQKMVDWDKREKELANLCEKYRSKDGTWDVIVPGSGGKDGSYVAYRLKKDFGMTPLTVTRSPMIPSELGRENLENFVKAGFDNIQNSPNGEINRKLSKITFEEFGDSHLPFIYGIINLPFHIVIKYNIKLIFYGEDGELEYGGSLERYNQPTLETKYTIQTKFTSLTPQHWKSHGINNSHLQNYLPPSFTDIKKIGIRAHYFSYYENWKPEQNFEIVKKHLGFKAIKNGRSEGTFTNFASLDDKIYGFHYYMAFIKFGIGRATSDANHQIRDGIITRDTAVELVQKHDSEFPKKYFNEFLDYLGITKNEFSAITDKFRRKIIWKRNGGEWKLRHQVFKL